MNLNLEQVLSRELRPVAAPRELWDRVQLGQDVPGPIRARYLGWALAGLAAVLMVGIIWNFRTVPVVAAETDSPQFRSREATEIRGWVKANAGFDVPLRPGSVQLIGASVRNGSAEVVCRVGDRPARLVVSKSRPGPFDGARHHVLSSSWFRGGRALSWIMRGQLYTLACATPEDLKAACFLCHGG